MPWIQMLGVAVLAAFATGGLVWFGWALAHNLFMVIKVRKLQNDIETEPAEPEASVDPEAEVIL